MHSTTTTIFVPKRIREKYFIFPNGYYVKKEILNELQKCDAEIFSKDNKLKIKLSINRDIGVYGDVIKTSSESESYVVLNEMSMNYRTQIEGRMYSLKSSIEFPSIIGKVKIVEMDKGGRLVTWLGTENPE